MRIALLRKGLLDNGILHEVIAARQRDIEEQQRYVEALEGHVSGLEHNIEVLTESLAAPEGRYQTALAQRAPLTRGLYNRFRRIRAKSR